jgi:hypothetical protein
MTDPTAAFPAHFRFAYRPGEALRLRELAGHALDRTMPWYSFWVVLLGMFFVIGFVVLGAQRSGVIDTDEVPTVLFTAYMAYGCGTCLVLRLMQRRRRRLIRASARAIERDDVVWDFDVDDAGIALKSDGYQTHLAWRRISLVQVWRGDVLIGLRLTTTTLGLPGRLFADDAARGAFVAAVRERIAAAKAAKAAP